MKQISLRFSSSCTCRYLTKVWRQRWINFRRFLFMGKQEHHGHTSYMWTICCLNTSSLWWRMGCGAWAWYRRRWYCLWNLSQHWTIHPVHSLRYGICPFNCGPTWPGSGFYYIYYKWAHAAELWWQRRQWENRDWDTTYVHIRKEGLCCWCSSTPLGPRIKFESRNYNVVFISRQQMCSPGISQTCVRHVSFLFTFDRNSSLS